jgi:hypothetical protein
MLNVFYTECRIWLSVTNKPIMLIVIIVCVVMLSVIILSVVALVLFLVYEPGIEP